MKRNIPAFLSGALTTALVGTIAVSALAVSGRMTIEVDPINVQVNGEVFQPKDVNGNEVPVFVYNGTTYAPLRALAEAYGLEVGYDKATNMATVAAPEAPPEPTPAPDTTAKLDYSDWSTEDEAAYQEFKGLWKVKYIGTTRYSETPLIDMRCDQTENELETFMLKRSTDTIEKYCLRIDGELLEQYGEANIMYHFMKWNSWGWQDISTDNNIKCGYKDFFTDYMNGK